MTRFPGGVLMPSLRVDRTAPGGLSLQLAGLLRDRILSGELPPGARLPASRTLAGEQGVSRTTVVSAYEQLVAEGLLVSRVGAGTHVCEDIPVRVERAPPPADARLPRLATLSRETAEPFFPRLAHPRAPLAFVTGMPALDVFPLALWARLSARHWRGERAAILSYPDAAGTPALRAAICRHLRTNRGLVCQPEEVFVFAGAQDAFARIAQLLLDPGDPVWIENPGAIGARNAFIARGAELAPAPVDAQGLDVAAARAACPAPRLVFVTPAHQHPLGGAMSRARRFELLAAAEACGAWIVEDDYVGEFHYGPTPTPPLKALDGGGRVIYVGTFSKSLFPALRLGFAVVPPSLADIFERTLGAVAHGVAHAVQDVVAAFILEGHFAVHLRRMREVYRARRDALATAAARHLAGLITVAPTDTGFHTVGLLADPARERRVAEAAAAEGLAATPLSRYALAPLAIGGVTLGFSAVPPALIARGVERLAEVLRRTP